MLAPMLVSLPARQADSSQATHHVEPKSFSVNHELAAHQLKSSPDTCLCKEIPVFERHRGFQRVGKQEIAEVPVGAL